MTKRGQKARNNNRRKATNYLLFMSNTNYSVAEQGSANQFVKVSYETAKDFGRNQRNRKVKKSHVNDFYQWIMKHADEIAQSGVCYGPYPIHVNRRTGNILDGQHRNEAFLKAIENGIIPPNTLLCVSYEDYSEDEEITRIIDLNTYNQNWQLDDYIECERDYNENFSRLTEFAESHELCYEVKRNGVHRAKYRYAAAILTGKGCSDVLKKRTIQITEDDLKRGEMVHSELVEIRKELCKKKGIEYNPNETKSDMEAMAIVWSKYRNTISVRDIKRTDIPKRHLNKDSRKQSDWIDLFNSVVSKKVTVAVA